MILSQPIQDVLIQYMTTTALRKKPQGSKKQPTTFNFRKVKPVTLSQVSYAWLKRQNSIGIIIIPAVHLKLPIYRGLNNNNLVKGAGTMKPRQKMGEENYALAGHHMTNPRILFSPLQNIKLGNTIYLISKSKKVYSYRVTQKKIISKYQINYIKNIGKKRIVTLITCASGKPEEPRRIMVRGILNQG